MTREPWKNRIVGHGEEDPEQLLASPRNWRIHPKAQQAALAGAIADIGYIRSVTVNKTTNTVLDGHLRVALAIRNSEKSIPVEYVELSEAEEAEAMATLDPIGAMAVADREQLDALLREVQTGDAAVQQMLADLAKNSGLDYGKPEDADAEPQVDRAEELRVKWGVQSGDLWRIGDHRLLCADSTKREDVERVMGRERAGAIIADPPYGMRLDTDFSGMVNSLGMFKSKGLRHGNKYMGVIGDDTDFDAVPVIAAYSDPACQFWFGADYYSSSLPDAEHSGAWLVWDKRLDESADKMFGSCFELIWCRHKCKRDILRFKWAGVFGTEHESQRGRLHPNQKPVDLLSELVSRSEGIIADPFAGAGSVIIACQNLGRRCRAIEISPAYVAVCLERMATAFPGIEIERGA